MKYTIDKKDAYIWLKGDKYPEYSKIGIGEFFKISSVPTSCDACIKINNFVALELVEGKPYPMHPSHVVTRVSAKFYLGRRKYETLFSYLPNGAVFKVKPASGCKANNVVYLKYAGDNVYDLSNKRDNGLFPNKDTVVLYYYDANISVEYGID